MHTILRTTRANLTRTMRQRFQTLNNQADIPEESRSIQQAALEFAEKRLLPNAAEWDRKHHFPVDVLKEAAQQGFAAIYVSPEYGLGGCGLDRLTASLIMEALAYGCVSTSAYISIHNMCSWMIDTFGSNELKANWIPRLATMDVLSSYCLTEPGSGSDAKAMRSYAKQDGGDWVLNGSKCFISGGSVSDVYVVMCKTGQDEVSTLLVEKGMKGLSFGKLEDKLGWRSQPTTMVMFEDVRVPKSNLIGTQGHGFKYAMKALDGGRINIGSCSLGGAQFALDKTKEYIGIRRQFGKTLSEFQHLQFKFADMATTLTSSRLMIRHAARLLDQQSPDATMYCAMAKRYATDNCFQMVNDALQMHGGYGYLNDYPIERVLRDLRVHSILEGTNEIMRLIIQRELLKA